MCREPAQKRVVFFLPPNPSKGPLHRIQKPTKCGMLETFMGEPRVFPVELQPTKMLVSWSRRGGFSSAKAIPKMPILFETKRQSIGNLLSGCPCLSRDMAQENDILYAEVAIPLSHDPGSIMGRGVPGFSGFSFGGIPYEWEGTAYSSGVDIGSNHTLRTEWPFSPAGTWLLSAPLLKVTNF